MALRDDGPSPGRLIPFAVGIIFAILLLYGWR